MNKVDVCIRVNWRGVLKHGSLLLIATSMLELMILIAIVATGCGRASKPTATNRESIHSTRSETNAADDSGDLSKIASVQSHAPLTEDPIDQVDRLIQAGETNKAMAQLRQLLVVQPNDAGVLFRLASLLADTGDLVQAVELLSGIPVSHPDAGLPALGQAADWCFQLDRYDEAEQKYQQLLELAPDAVLAHRQLAYLLNRQGRRHEAAEHVRALCRLGDVRQDELHSLVILSDAMYDDPEQPVADESLPYWPIGSSGQARYLLNQQRYVEALETLRPEISKGKVRPAVSALYGRILIEAQDDEGFRAWLLQSTDSVKQFSDYWAALGTYLLVECRFDESAKALSEAIDRDPTDLISMGRLRQALLALGQDSLAKQWEERWLQTREILRVNNRVSAAKPPNPDLMSDLAIRLHDLGYELQAILWKSIEAALRGLPNDVQRQLNAERERLLKINDAFPDQNERLCGMDLQQFPWPDLKRMQSADPQRLGNEHPVAGSQEHQRAALVTARFINVAENVGLNHSFSVATSPQESGFAIYQILGAAIAVLDYDLDGAPDFYLGQGAADPPLFRSQISNTFYRNVQHKLVDVTAASNTSDFGYSTGITSGDWNQDGFQDLVVANLGSDVLLVNNGDGSFQSRSLFTDQSLTRVPTSMAIADVTGDHLPDLFQAAYVDDQDIAKRPARNDEGLVISSLVPTDFKPGKDRLIANGVDGTPAPQSWDPDDRHTAAGLGVVVANFDDRAGNEIFIGNDLYANQLWRRDVTTGAWSEVALPLGCAYGFTGNATASMGISTGDYDNNGTLDLHITNFQDDASSLFLLDNGVYRDRNQQFQINTVSRSVLGFGTQSIDFDNDGLLDIVVTNGHVEDEAQSPAPFRQLPQLFRNMEGRFELIEVTDTSGYWSSKYLGRGLARIDFNRDGRMDCVITHLEAPTALLINQTDSQNHWLQLQLVGTQSERDAIGARVQVKAGNSSSFHWVTAGDGYLCRNELMLPIGLGQATQVEELSIEWPSGITQTIRDIPIDRRLLIIENQTDPVPL